MTGESIYLKRHKTIPIGVIWMGVSTSAAGADDELIDTDIPAAYGLNSFKDERLFIYYGTGAGQTRKIEAYNAGTFTLYDDWVTNPDTDSRYQVISGDGVSGAGAGDATAANQAAIIDALYDAGIAAYPAAAVPGNGVSLAEVLRQVYDDISTLGGYDATAANQTTIRDRQAEVSDVVIYPVAEHAGTTEIADDGTSPAFYADDESGTATTEPTPNLPTPNVHWSEDIDFEQEGSIDVISIFAELRWQHKTSGGTAYSKVQMSRDGGSNWVDMTDSIAEAGAAYADKTRIGVGRFVNTIVAGVDQLQFRLVSWEAGGATSGAKMRSDSYVRITYRKS